MSIEERKPKKWLPLEANPAVMEDFLRPLGIPDDVEFHDIYGLDEELLAIVPQPVHATLFLLPVDETTEVAQKEEIEKIKEEGQIVNEKVWFTLQTVRNACGTVGLLHAIGNNLDFLNIKEGSYLDKFFKNTKDKTPLERGRYLEEDDEMEVAHADAAITGDSAAPEISDPVDLHFVAFVVVDGHLYELDGSRPFPINRGPASRDDILQATAGVVKKYIERNPNSIHFNLIAITR